jgi:hypothetical protein
MVSAVAQVGHFSTFTVAEVRYTIAEKYITKLLKSEVLKSVSPFRGLQNLRSGLGRSFRGLEKLRSDFGAENPATGSGLEKFENSVLKKLCDGAQKMRENDGTENTSTDERPRSSVSGGKRRPG